MGLGMSLPLFSRFNFSTIYFIASKTLKWTIYVKYFLSFLLLLTIIWVLNILYNFYNYFFIFIFILIALAYLFHSNLIFLKFILHFFQYLSYF